MEYLIKLIARSYYKMNITDFLNVMEFTPEEDRALLYSTSATLILCCAYKGFFLSNKVCTHVCSCLAQKYADRKKRDRVTPSPEPFEKLEVVVPKSEGLKDNTIV